MLGWVLLLIIDFCLFCCYSFKHSFIFFILIAFLFVWKSKVFKGITFNKAVLKPCELFYIEYSGDYYQISKEYEKLSIILKKFNLNRQVYNIFGVIKNLPKKMDKNSKAVIGIIRQNKSGNETTKITNREEDFLDYIIKNKFKKAVVPETESILSSFPFSNEMSMTIGVKKFYSTLDSSLQNEDFKNDFSIDRNKFKVVMEIYEKEDVYFYIPLRNQERFNLVSD